MLLNDEETKLIRFQVARYLGWSHLKYSQSGVLLGHAPGQRSVRPVPTYADDIKAAWEIVEYLTARGVFVRIENKTLVGYVRNYFVEMGDFKCKNGQAQNIRAPLAICQAFTDFIRVRRSDSGDF